MYYAQATTKQVLQSERRRGIPVSPEETSKCAKQVKGTCADVPGVEIIEGVMFYECDISAASCSGHH